jgi:hypothetical protein
MQHSKKKIINSKFIKELFNFFLGFYVALTSAVEQRKMTVKGYES